MLSKGSRILPWLLKTYPYQILIFLAFISIFGVAFWIDYFLYEDEVNGTIHRNKSIASFTAKVILGSLEGEIGRIQAYASRPLLIEAARNKDSQEMNRHLASLKKSHPEIDIVFVTDKNGKVWANFPVAKAAHGKSFSQSDWYKHASQEREPYVSNVYAGFTGEGKPAIVVCSPILDIKGEVIGILVVYQGIAFMQYLADAFIWDNDLKMSLIDRAGRILYSNRYDYEKKITDYPLSRCVKKTMEEGKWDLTVEDPSEGGEIKYLAFEPIKGIGWSVIVEKAKKKIFNSVIGRIVEYSIIALLLFIVFALSLGYLRKELVFRLLAERRKAEQVLLNREREAQRLAKENAVMAEIGRIISSTLKIEEVYHCFAEEAGKLIQFDRIIINIINHNEGTFVIAFAAGAEVPDRRVGVIVPLAGTGTEEVVRTCSTLLVQGDNWEEVIGRIPGHLPLFKAGFRSIMSIPLVSKDRVIGILSFQSFKPNAYAQMDLTLAERVSTQIAGAVANAQLFLERKEVEEVLREAEERYRLLFEISTDGVLVRDREGIIRLANPMAVKMLNASRLDEIIGKAYLDFVHPGDRPESISRIQRSIKALQGEPGIDAADMVSPVREHRLVALDGEIVYVESSGTSFHHQGQAWIQGSFHNITKRKQAEDALRESEELARRTAKGIAAVAEIGRIISSTLNIENIYERFAEQARELIPFDYIVITTINQEEGTLHIGYVSGYLIQGRGPGDVISLAGSFSGEAARRRSIQLAQTEDAEEVAARFPKLLPFWQQGFRSFMAVPLISNDQVVGVLCFYSMRSRAYKEADTNLAEQIAAQIAGAIANAQLFQELKQTAEELGESELRYRVLLEASGQAGQGMAILQAVGPDESICIFANEEAERITGYTMEELGRSSWIEIVNPSFQEEVKGRILRRLKGEPAPGLSQFVIRNKTGREVPVETTSTLTKLHGQEVLIVFLRDISERKRADEALRKREEEARKLANENAIVAKIGRIISSSFSIEKVYKLFTEEVKNLLSFDRIAITIINPEKNSLVNPYVEGIPIPGKDQGDVYPLRGTLAEAVFQAERGLFTGFEDEDEVRAKFPGLLPEFSVGLRSLLAVPLISRQQIIGSLTLVSREYKAYSQEDLRLAEGVVNQIAGAVFNAQLFLELKRAEEQLKASLKEKEVLLREIHHRVKNNLQVISSLLRLQSRYIGDDVICRYFKESQDRVKTMAIIHEKLYQSTDLARVDFAEYIKDLTANLYRSYGVSREAIGLRIQVNNLFLDIDTANPCGLIINELVSNSLKHAFPGGGRGEIFIDLRSDHDQIILTVGDNGGAFPKGLDFRKTGTLGLQLVTSLTEQLEGTIELHSDGKTEFRIAFPARDAR